METKFAAILNNLPEIQRSCLEPYSELIREMRKRGRSYREITNVLKESCGVTVGKSTVHDFVLSHSKWKTKTTVSRSSKTNRNNRALTGLRSTYKDTEARKSTVSHSKTLEVTTRTIKNVKDQLPKISQKKLLFEYNPEEPLRLHPRHKQ